MNKLIKGIVKLLMINGTSVAGAVLQTALSSIGKFINKKSTIKPYSSFDY